MLLNFKIVLQYITSLLKFIVKRQAAPLLYYSEEKTFHKNDGNTQLALFSRVLRKRCTIESPLLMDPNSRSFVFFSGDQLSWKVHSKRPPYRPGCQGRRNIK